MAILLGVALLVFGGRGLPEAGRTIGKGLREFRKAMNEARDAIERPDDPPAAPPPTPPDDSRPRRLLD